MYSARTYVSVRVSKVLYAKTDWWIWWFQTHVDLVVPWLVGPRMLHAARKTQPRNAPEHTDITKTIPSNRCEMQSGTRRTTQQRNGTGKTAGGSCCDIPPCLLETKTSKRNVSGSATPHFCVIIPTFHDQPSISPGFTVEGSHLSICVA